MRQCEICKKYNARICSPCIYTGRTVFQEITQSLEVLAEKLVYQSGRFQWRRWSPRKGGWSDPRELWRSTLIPGCDFDSEAEAIEATVAKLKEVIG